MSNTFVVVLGIGTVFFGLICLIVLCKIVGLFCGGASKEKDQATAVAKTAAPVAAASQPIENRQEIIAAVSAVVAEELGTSVEALKIISFKKI